MTDANVAARAASPGRRCSAARIALDADGRARPSAASAARLGLATSGAAEGIVAVANALMADAIREITVARGIDPRDFDLLAFGGAGPAARRRARRGAEIARVVVPRRRRGRSRPGGCCTLESATTSCERSSATLGAVEAGELARRSPSCASGRGRAARRRRRRRARALRRERRPALSRPGVHAERPAGPGRRRHGRARPRLFTDAHHVRYGHNEPERARSRS